MPFPPSEASGGEGVGRVEGVGGADGHHSELVSCVF